MIRVAVDLDREGYITGFDVAGHSGYDKPGRDIVCAAVSAVVQTAVIGLTDVAGVAVKYHQEDGNANCSMPAGLCSQTRENADIILKTMLSGLKSIQMGYSKYISIVEKEVG